MVKGVLEFVGRYFSNEVNLIEEVNVMVKDVMIFSFTGLCVNS